MSASSPTSSNATSCSYYLAPSAIPGSGYGVFSGVDYPAGHVGFESFGIPFWGGFSHGNDFDDYLSWGPLVNYAWNGRQGSNGPSSYEVVVGVGSMLNHWDELSEVQVFEVENGPGTGTEGGVWDDDRRFSPGAGAQSGRTEWRFKVANRIRGGDEIYTHYGYDWFKERGMDKLGSSLSLSPGENENENDADSEHFSRVIESLQVFFLGGGMSASSMNRVLSAVRDEILDEYIPDFLVGIPYDVDALMSMERPHKLAKPDIRYHARPVDWIRSNGICADNIEVKMSHVPMGGRGAFARRVLKEGEIISRSPLLHAPRGDLELTDPKFRKAWEDRIKKEVRMHNLTDDQLATGKLEDLFGVKMLALNYVIGNPSANDPLMFVPTTAAAFMNHNFDGAMRNVRVEWSDEKSTEEKLKKPLSWFRGEESAAVSVDFIATRDIKEGEELFVNYGLEWELAWLSHLEGWVPSDLPAKYRDPTKYNQIDPETGQLPPIIDPSPHEYFHCKFDADRSALCLIEGTLETNKTHAPQKFRTCFLHKASRDAFTCDPATSSAHSRDGISVVEQPFAGSQWLRNSFRHELGFESLRERWPAREDTVQGLV